jgi:hypothetical protein
MKQSKIHTKNDFGKRSGSSSHYRINRGENPVHISEIIKRCLEELRMKRYVNQCSEERSVV